MQWISRSMVRMDTTDVAVKAEKMALHCLNVSRPPGPPDLVQTRVPALCFAFYSQSTNLLVKRLSPAEGSTVQPTMLHQKAHFDRIRYLKK